MQKNTPKKRKQIRLKEYDYSTPGYYFITICTQNRKEILSKFNKNILKQNENTVGADDPVRPKRQNYNAEEKLKLTPIGIIVEQCWKEIDKIYDNVKTDEFIIMPNHIHGIIILNGRTGSSAPTKNYARI